MSEFANASGANDIFSSAGIFAVGGMPSEVNAFATIGLSGSVPTSNAVGFLSKSRCLIPNAASPASKTPGFRCARGSEAFEPVIPGGRAGGACGGPCANAAAAKPIDTNAITAINRSKFDKFRVFIFLLFLSQHFLHNSDLGSLAAVNVCRKVKKFGVLTTSRSVKEFFDHRKSSAVVLYHSR